MSRLYLYMALTCFWCAHAIAAKPPAVEFVREGFCITPSGTSCSEVILPNTMVDIKKLPKLPDGTPILYFYSEQKAPPKTSFVHILEAVDVDPHVDYLSPERGQLPPGPLKNALEAMIKKNAPDDGVIVIPYTGEAGVASYIPVTTPGAYQASVTDLKGAMLPGSSRITVTIIKRQ